MIGRVACEPAHAAMTDRRHVLTPDALSMMDIIARTGSFAAAAQDVGLSPSAVSKLVARLEQRLGVRLINRTTRRLALTTEGRLYLNRSREILAAIEATEAERVLITHGYSDTVARYLRGIGKDADILASAWAGESGAEEDQGAHELLAGALQNLLLHIKFITRD